MSSLIFQSGRKKLCFFSHRNCGLLRVAPFPKVYAIPSEIEALVKGQKGAANFMDMLLKLAPARARLKTETYHQSFTTKLFLEEAAGQSKKYDQYHMENIRIECVNNDIFRFKIIVSSNFDLLHNNIFRSNWLNICLKKIRIKYLKQIKMISNSCTTSHWSQLIIGAMTFWATK